MQRLCQPNSHVRPDSAEFDEFEVRVGEVGAQGRQNDPGPVQRCPQRLDCLVRVGVQSAIPHPETAALIRKLMKERDLAIPPPISGSVCITQICK